MSYVEASSRTYTINNEPVSVRWLPYNFEKQVAGIADKNIRDILCEAGVMYVPTANPSILVSNRLALELQGLSAVHEELCMNQKRASCPTVEEMVLDSIVDPELRTDYLTTRSRLFGAFCLMDDSNELFAATAQLLAAKSNAQQ